MDDDLGVVTVSSQDPLTIVLLGEFDFSNIVRVDAVLATGHGDMDVIVNVENVSFASAALLNSMVARAVVAAAAGADFVVVAPSPVVSRLLDITGTRRHFRVVASSGVSPPQLRTGGRDDSGRLQLLAGLRSREEWAALSDDEVSALGRGPSTSQESADNADTNTSPCNEVENR